MSNAAVLAAAREKRVAEVDTPIGKVLVQAPPIGKLRGYLKTTSNGAGPDEILDATADLLSDAFDLPPDDALELYLLTGGQDGPVLSEILRIAGLGAQTPAAEEAAESDAPFVA